MFLGFEGHVGLVKNPVVEMLIRAAPFFRFIVKRYGINKNKFSGLAYGLRGIHCKAMINQKMIWCQIHTRVRDRVPHKPMSKFLVF